ncbi:hypothetical protein AVEN_209284-1 [Araneus ventricosus]|uniref:Uncharacterized protein n=1 Tax=Araneus ventricosus TaxID=182803 RepID=A0A4Y2CAV5_ARAVE|nr:hypothetical protein AVEN_209284-1 [Araneus ventricosus]
MGFHTIDLVDIPTQPEVDDKVPRNLLDYTKSLFGKQIPFSVHRVRSVSFSLRINGIEDICEDCIISLSQKRVSRILKRLKSCYIFIYLYSIQTGQHIVETTVVTQLEDSNGESQRGKLQFA